jgi:hypothetical protein
MKRSPQNSASPSGFFNRRVLLVLTLCAAGLFFAALGFASTPSPGWSLVTSPNPSGTNSALSSVACTSANNCWTVGSGNVIAHWDGSSWAIVTSPDVPGSVLNSVVCSSALECWTVGTYGAHTLIEHWDGTSWTVAASPNNGALGNTLSGVTCASTSDCWAAGYYSVADTLGNQTTQTLVEHWNGASWSIVSSPNNNPVTTNCGLLDECRNFFKAVTCASASDCWAVGTWGNIAQALIEHWDGNSWSIVTLPDTSNTGINDVPNGVTCASASDCWIVGSSDDGEGDFQTLIERWDGSSWAIVPSPNPSTISALSSVACVSGSDCWAVGSNGNGNASQTLLEQWDGSSWSIFTSPDTSGRLNGVTCASASHCWAVGHTITGSTTQTLIEEYAPSVPALTSVVSRKIHGSVGTFDIDLPLVGTPGIECRSGGANGTYQMIFTFVNNLTSCGTNNIGSLSSGPGLNQCTVDLTGVANQQYVTIALNNVIDSQNNSGNVATTMGVLVGDVNSSKRTDSGDVTQVRSHTVLIPDIQTFRLDVDASGRIDAGDVTTTRNASVTVLP